MRIRFTRQGSNSAFGGFKAGDIFVCGDALGRHLVEEAKVAEYLPLPAPASAGNEPATTPRAPATAPGKRKAK